MNDKIIETTIEVLGKKMQIKCQESQVSALQKAAQLLHEKMIYFRTQGVLEFDKMAVIAALNFAHQLLNFEAQKENHLQNINQRLSDLQNKVDHALEQMELQEYP